MKLGIPVGERVYWLEIMSSERIGKEQIGFRRFDKVLLRDDIFDEFVYACSIDDGPAMKGILEGVIDIEALQLSNVPWELKETAQGLLLA